MVCTSVQQTAPRQEAETHDSVESERSSIVEQTSRYDEDARKIRKHIAQEEALRELEQRKARALAAVHILSFIR